MLDAIGAGATAKTNNDWGQLWTESEECKLVTKEIENLCQQRKNAKVSKFMKDQREYAMPLTTQIVAVTRRSFTSYWRDPDYLLGKYVPHYKVDIDSSSTWSLVYSTRLPSGCYQTVKWIYKIVSFRSLLP